jgi:hypothetical protein
VKLIDNDDELRKRFMDIGGNPGNLKIFLNELNNFDQNSPLYHDNIRKSLIKIIH